MLREQGELSGTRHGTPTDRARCPGCGATDTDAFFYLDSTPVNCSALWRTHAEAIRCSKGTIDLAFCENCGLVFNCRFDPKALDYNAQYDNSLSYSPIFRDYAKNLAENLIDRYRLHSKKIIGIGSGKGEFLRLLCGEGHNEGVGYDPSYSGNGCSGEVTGLRFVQDYYGERYASEPVDFVCCRHVLEHIPEPLRFLKSLREALARHGEVAVYFETPNGKSVFSGPGLWDIIYPHVSYFTEESLRALFEHAGFRVLRSGTSFSNQFVFIEAGLGENRAESNRAGDTTHRAVLEFNTTFQQAVADWSHFLKAARAKRTRIAFWGAGAKGVTFLNVVPEAQHIESVIDLNVRKQGMYVPGTGQRIAAPIDLKDNPPDYLVSLNPVYEPEISGMLHSMGITAQVMTDTGRVNALAASN